jgi:glutamate synthase (NADPH/NADH) large chain
MADEALLKMLVERHATYTGSERAKAILADWAAYRKFVKVMPHEYRRALAEMAAQQQKELEAA